MKKFKISISLLIILISISVCAKVAVASKKKLKPSNWMGQSKAEIQAILNEYNDKEGAFIKVIRKVGQSRYRLNIVGLNKKCSGSEVQIKSTKVIYDLREYKCD